MKCSWLAMTCHAYTSLAVKRLPWCNHHSDAQLANIHWLDGKPSDHWIIKCGFLGNLVRLEKACRALNGVSCKFLTEKLPLWPGNCVIMITVSLQVSVQLSYQTSCIVKFILHTQAEELDNTCPLQSKLLNSYFVCKYFPICHWQIHKLTE